MHLTIKRLVVSDKGPASRKKIVRMRGIRLNICGNRGCFADGYRAAVPNLVNIQGVKLMHTKGLRHTRAARQRLVGERGR